MGLQDYASANGGIVSLVLRFLVRFLQFIFALIVAGLYGYRLDEERKAAHYVSSQWVYAVVVGGLSAITCIVYMLPHIRSYLIFGWDAFLFILWVAVFGTFGAIYIPRDDAHPYEDTNTQRMKYAVWVDLINMLLWFFTAAYGLAMFLGIRKEKTLHTGRAYV